MSIEAGERTPVAEREPSAPPRLTLLRAARAEHARLRAGMTLGWASIAVALSAALGGLAIGVALWGNARAAGEAVPAHDVVAQAMLIGAIPAHLFGVLYGADAIAGEISRGTVYASLTVSPRRGLFGSAKVLAVTTAVLPAALLAGLASGGAALIVLASVGAELDTALYGGWIISILGLTLATLILSCACVWLGAALRSRNATILVALLTLHVLPVTLHILWAGFTPRGVDAILPGTAASSLSVAGLPHDITSPLAAYGASLTSAGVAALVLGAWCAVAVAVGAAAFLRRDVTAASRLRARRVTRAARPRPPRPLRITAARMLRAEFVKTWSLTSTRWALALTIALALLFGFSRAAYGDVADVGPNLADALLTEYCFALTAGVGTGGLLVGLVSILQAAGEFGTGTAVPTFVAAQRRWRVTSAKSANACLTAVVFGVASIVPAGVLITVVYLVRGFDVDATVIGAGAASFVRALVFLVLLALLSSGMAGTFRRTATAILALILSMEVLPALFNTIQGLTRTAHSPLVAVGNATAFLPWQGIAFYGPPPPLAEPFVSVAQDGSLAGSPLFGITITAAWTVLFLTAWFLVDARCAITVRRGR